MSRKSVSRSRLKRERRHRVGDDARQPAGVEGALLEVELPGPALLRLQPALQPVGEPRHRALQRLELLVEIGAQPLELDRVGEVLGGDLLVEPGHVDLVGGVGLGPGRRRPQLGRLARPRRPSPRPASASSTLVERRLQLLPVGAARRRGVVGGRLLLAPRPRRRRRLLLLRARPPPPRRRSRRRRRRDPRRAGRRSRGPRSPAARSARRPAGRRAPRRARRRCRRHGCRDARARAPCTFCGPRRQLARPVARCRTR